MNVGSCDKIESKSKEIEVKTYVSMNIWNAFNFFGQ